MIQSLDLVYGACKYDRLNRFHSLVCMSPDTSEAKEKEAEEVAEVELRRGKRVEKAINGSRPSQHENGNHWCPWEPRELIPYVRWPRWHSYTVLAVHRRD